jgi:hypothetical protein
MNIWIILSILLFLNWLFSSALLFLPINLFEHFGSFIWLIVLVIILFFLSWCLGDN